MWRMAIVAAAAAVLSAGAAPACPLVITKLTSGQLKLSPDLQRLSTVEPNGQFGVARLTGNPNWDLDWLHIGPATFVSTPAGFDRGAATIEFKVYGYGAGYEGIDVPWRVNRVTFYDLGWYWAGYDYRLQIDVRIVTAKAIPAGQYRIDVPVWCF
jgi:hypothetical protein